MTDLNRVAHKILFALNRQYGLTITITDKRFINRRTGHTYTIHYIMDNIEEDGVYKQRVLYKTGRQYYVVLCLRDLLYEAQGKELPTDLKEWNEEREKILSGRNRT